MCGAGESATRVWVGATGACVCRCSRRVVCGAERRRRPATGRGAVRCAGGWRADAWGCRRGSACRVQAGGILLRQEHQERRGRRRCASVGRNRQSAGDNEPLVCRPLQVVSYARDSGFAVRIKGGVQINCNGNHNEPLVCRPPLVVSDARDSGYLSGNLVSDVVF